MAQFAVKAENHILSMLPVMENLKTVGCFVDVSLVCEGRTIKAHKLVLAAGSPFFRQIFLENPCQHPVIILQDIKYSILKEIIDFLYKGELVMPTEDIQNFLKTVKTLDVKNLIDICNEELFHSRISNGLDMNHASEETKPTVIKKMPKVVGKQNLGNSVEKALESAEICLSTNNLKALEFCSPVVVETYTQRDSSSVTTEMDTQHDSPSDIESSIPVEQEVDFSDQKTEDEVAVEEIEISIDGETDVEPDQKTTKCPQILFLSEKCKSIKQTIDRTPKKNPKRSGVWKFFKIVDHFYANCNSCQKNISYRGSVTNLAKHLRRRHKYDN